MTSLNQGRLYNAPAVAEAMAVIIDADQITELRALDATTAADRWPHTAYGYFDDAEKLVTALGTIKTAKGIYIIPNPVDRALLARASNRIRKALKGESTQDTNITRRRWLLIDADQQRPAGISATDAEHEAALEHARTIYAYLRDLGWADPIAADSGNGAHFLYRIDLPVDDGGLVQRCLEALAARFDDDAVKVDQKVFNPSRIWKLYGTLACKGDDTPDRPHRLSRILNAPNDLQTVDQALLETLAGSVGPSVPAEQTHSRNGEFDLESFISQHGLDVSGPNAWHGQQGPGKCWSFSTSPMCDHHDGAAHIEQHASGAITSGCHHNSCSWTWPDLRDQVEPGWRDRRKGLDRAQQSKKEGSSQTIADKLVNMALEHFRLGVSTSGETFAVERNGPAVAIMFRGSISALRMQLSRMFRKTNGKTPNTSALGDALVALEGMAMDCDPEPVALRLAEQDGGVILDLGNASGKAVVLTVDGWDCLYRSPVLFRRTALTGELPAPADVHDPDALNELRRLLNVGDDAWALVVGWLVASCIPNIPHPVLMLGGAQGTGKTMAARLMVGLVDASPALLQSQPRNPEAWAMAASGSWCVVIDNVSHIPFWWSDALCKAVTGDGWIRRKLYTDSDLAVLSFRRCVLLTSIDAGALRGDLGDRLLLVDLDQIDDSDRRTETDLDRRYAEAQPRLMAGLLSAVSSTLSVLPEIELDEMPRMADFARVLAALDRACPGLTSGRALDAYLGQQDRIAHDVVDSDPLAAALVKLVNDLGEWRGTAAELLDVLAPQIEAGKYRPPRGWPESARGMTAALMRLIPALKQLEIEVYKPKRRYWAIRRISPTTDPTVPTVQNSEIAEDSGMTVAMTDESVGTKPTDNRHDVTPDETKDRDGSDGSDGPKPVSSGRRRVRV